MYTDPTDGRIIRERDERLFNAAYNDSKFYEAGSKEFKFLQHIMWLADPKDPHSNPLTCEHISNFYSDLGVVDHSCYTKIMFQQIRIMNSKFVDIDFRHIPSLRGATFVNCKFDNCIFTCTRISSLNLCSCEFTKCEFISSNICCVSMSGDMVFDHCDFDGARMDIVHCHKCNTSSFKLIDCNCRIARFSGNVPPTFHGRSVYPKKWYKEHLSFSYPENKEEINMEKEINYSELMKKSEAQEQERLAFVKNVFKAAGLKLENCNREIHIISDSKDLGMDLTFKGQGPVNFYPMISRFRKVDIAKTPNISKVVSNPEQKFVLVWFDEDKEPVKVQCDEEDTFDPYVGVSIAMSKRLFKSTTQFRKAVDDVLIEQKPKVGYASSRKATDVKETEAEKQQTKEGENK